MKDQQVYHLAVRISREASCKVSVYLLKNETVFKLLSWFVRGSKPSWQRATSVFTAATWLAWG